jgi:hypothetical protein
MTHKNLFILNAVLGIVFGVGFVLAPAQALAPYGVTLPETGLVITRLLGAIFIQVGLFTWLVRNLTAADALRPIFLSFFIGNALGFVASLLSQLSGVTNALGWSTVVIYLVLAAGYGYFQFVKSGKM